MPLYKAVLVPRKTPGGRHRSHLRAVDVVFTAKDGEDAARMVHGSIVRLFLNSGDDFDVEQLLRL
jgi:hypothetical protein